MFGLLVVLPARFLRLPLAARKSLKGFSGCGLSKDDYYFYLERARTEDSSQPGGDVSSAMLASFELRPAVVVWLDQLSIGYEEPPQNWVRCWAMTSKTILKVDIRSRPSAKETGFLHHVKCHVEHDV